MRKSVSNAHALLTELRSCSIRRDLLVGHKLHAKAVDGRHLSNKYVMAALIKMYAKCGSMVDARRLFDNIQKPNVMYWTALLLGYAENGEGQLALELFSAMKAQGCIPDCIAYVAVLKACTSLAAIGDEDRKKYCLERGREIHTEIRHFDHYLQTTLVDMYAKCGSMKEARRVFDCIQNPDLVAWTTLLLGYAENGEGLAALDVFSRMKARGFTLDVVAYLSALKACSSVAVNADGSRNPESLDWGRAIHSQICCNLNPNLESMLIDMYSKCGSMIDARGVFDNIQRPDVVSWTALLLGYAENGDGHTTLQMFWKMKDCGCVPNSVTYVAVLKACGLTGALTLGKKLCLEITEFTDRIVTSLVDFYAKCGSMVEAREAFDLHFRRRGITTWNALIAGYGSFGDSDSVFNLFQAMLDEGVRPTDVTFLSMLMCCSHVGLVEKAREYFEVMPVKYGVPATSLHYTCMVDVLGRANQLNGAIVVLCKRPCNAVAWKALLGACRKWKNVEIGTMAFCVLISMGKNDSSAHLLMGHIYGCSGMWEEQKRVLQTMGWNLTAQ